MDTIIRDRLFALATESMLSGNRPMPALLCLGESIEFESTDRVLSSCDPTMHGEIAVIRKACETIGQPHLRGYRLIAFGEPCIMCCGAIHWAKLAAVEYCLSQEVLKKLTGGRQKPGIRDYLPVGNRGTQIIGPFFESEAYEIAKTYDWKANAV